MGVGMTEITSILSKTKAHHSTLLPNKMLAQAAKTCVLAKMTVIVRNLMRKMGRSMRILTEKKTTSASTQTITKT